VSRRGHVQHEDPALAALRVALAPLGSVAVAFSGGVDSSVLLVVAASTLGSDAVTAVTAASETYTPAELERAVAVAETLGVAHVVVRTTELDDERFVANPPERCYGCKAHMLDAVAAVAGEHGRAVVVDGVTSDDQADHRPGMLAAWERGVRHPLLEAGLRKADVRRLARVLRLANAAAPSQACLATRIPYGWRITRQNLRQVARAEEALRDLGFTDVRVRHYGTLARVEVPLAEVPRAAGACRAEILARLRRLGWIYVTVDLAGLRSGSMNEVLDVHSAEDGTREDLGR
jgi:uncharacterized protein